MTLPDQRDNDFESDEVGFLVHVRRPKLGDRFFGWKNNSLQKNMDCKSVTEKNRDRIETRTAYSTSDVAWLNDKEKWKNLNCIGAIKT